MSTQLRGKFCTNGAQFIRFFPVYIAGPETESLIYAVMEEIGYKTPEELLESLIRQGLIELTLEYITSKGIK